MTALRALSTGARIERVLIEDLPRVLMVQYAGASGDYNPLHTDERYAKEIAGYPTVFAHGMLIMGVIAGFVTDFIGDGTLTKYGGRFVGQLWPGDDLRASVEVVSIDDRDGDAHAHLAIEATNQAGAPLFTGTAVALIG
jgi:acyl dehydratase